MECIFWARGIFEKKIELELGLKKSNLISKVYVIISYFDANTA